MERRWTPIILAVCVATAVYVAATRRDSGVSEAREALSAVLPPVEDLSLYSCRNGNPGISSEFASGDWGTLDGDWYAIVENVEFEVECLREKFLERGDDDERLETWALFSCGSDSEIYDFNATYEAMTTGRYKLEAASIDIKKGKTWAEIFKVGTHKGKRWFGWYFCSPMLDITKNGYAAIYYEDSSASDDFVRELRSVLKDAGLLEHGDFYRVRQDKCDYTW